jgi:MscS family membrane protein
MARDSIARHPSAKRRVGRLPVAALAAACVMLAATASGAAPDSPAAAEKMPAKTEPAPVAPDSPRAAVVDYLEQCRRGDYAAAARHLALQGDQQQRGPELARRLKAVLDQHLWIDLSAVSPVSLGDETDGLPRGVDQLGTIVLSGVPTPVRLLRETGPESATWVFSPETVARIDRWYQALGDRWLQEHLPEGLLLPGPFEILRWQWAALPALLLIAWGVGRLLAWASLRLLASLAARTRSAWDDTLVRKLRGPVILAWSIGVAYPLTSALHLYRPAEAYAQRALGTAGLVALFWMLWRGVGVVGDALRSSPWAAGNPSAQSALSIGVRLTRVVVLAAGAVTAVSHLGYPVAGLLAGLGLGGLAFALAAQKTVENLFGSLSLAIDAPFHVGDFVKVEDFVGTVEAIGLRSTRIRTLDRTLITIPNGHLADMRLESYTARDRIRLACTLGLVYETTSAQMRQVLEALEATLRAHPLIWPDAVVVRFAGFGASSLDIEIMAWFQTSSWPEFQLVRQNVFLQFMEVVEQAGTSFAFPTQTLHLVDERGSPPAAPSR